jgi:diguanylate cyclase (GGDEF)-like protein/PAS domain S-box-containing protein
VILGRLKRWLFGSLRKQLTVGMASIVAVLMLLFIWDMTRHQQAEQINRNSKQVTALAESVATTSAVWVVSHDYSGLQEIVQGVARFPNLRHVIVLDLKGQVLANNDPTKIGLYLTDVPQNPNKRVVVLTKNLISTTSPIMLGDKQVGWVKIDLDRAPFNATLAEMRRGGLIYLLIAIALSALLATLTGRYLTGRLYAIKKVADAVQTGESDARVIMSGDDEAAIFARQFNSMLDSLAQREEQLQSFYELDLVGLTITSPEKGWIRINKCLCDMLEYSEQELLGMTWAQLTHPEDLGVDVEQFNRLLANEINGYSLDKRFISRTGKIVPTKLVVGCIRKPDGKVDYVTAMVEDITERKKAEDATRAAAQYSRSLIEASLDPLVTISPEGKVTDVNTATEQVTGVNRIELIGSDFADYFTDPGKAREGYQQVFSEGFVTDYPLAIRHASGKVTDVLYNASVYRDDTGNVLGVFAAARDVTERMKAEEATKAASQYSRSLIEASLDPLVTISPEGKVTDVNTATEQVTGVNRTELIGSDFADYFTDPDKAREGYQQVFSEGYVTDFPLAIRHASGKVTDVLYNASVYRDDTGNVLGVFAAARDVTERMKAEQQQRIAATAFESQEGILVTDANHLILRVNHTFTRITGYTVDEVVGQNPSLLSSGRHDADFYAAMWKSINTTGAWEGEIWNRRKNGEVYPEHLTITAVKDVNDIITNYVATLTDITLTKTTAEKIEQLAFYDPLTNLPNRRLLVDRLHQALASSTRSGKAGALLFIDLDNFKTLNDTLGHDVGDLLLQQVALRLTTCVREGDTVARLGGDEFVVMLDDLSEQNLEAAAQAEIVANKILDALNEPYMLDRHEYHNTPSIGTTLFNEQKHKQDADELLKQADIAMYQAKKSGRNTLRFFDPAMQESINNRVTLENELREALGKKQFELYYQIQVHSSGRALGAEALIRWQHPERGLVSPALFIPVAEETGLILPIGSWVLDTACAQIQAWQQNALAREFQVSVNVSAKQFHQADFVAQVKDTVQRHAINPKLLKLELTESMLLDNIDDTIATMNALKEIGIQFSLDDFGTGYSSLQYLKRLPLNQLKIDQSFVRDITVNSSDQAIVRTIIAMAQSLELDYIAEGVETEEQRQLLLDQGCTHYQGYLFGKPVPLDEFEAPLKQI